MSRASQRDTSGCLIWSWGWLTFAAQTLFIILVSGLYFFLLYIKVLLCVFRIHKNILENKKNWLSELQTVRDKHPADNIYSFGANSWWYSVDCTVSSIQVIISYGCKEPTSSLSAISSGYYFLLCHFLKADLFLLCIWIHIWRTFFIENSLFFDI